MVVVFQILTHLHVQCLDRPNTIFVLFSHFSLLLGCALPKWMSSGFNDRPLTPFAGILSLGIGDTMVGSMSSA